MTKAIYFWLMLNLLLIQTTAASEQPTALTLRPGDSVLLSLPGESSLNFTTQIQRNGDIVVPEVGRIQIADLTLAQANEQIQKQLEDYFQDVNRFELIIKKRQLLINVLGYVKKPGPVTLENGANIQEAISAAEGLAAGAQLDKVQIRRGEQVFTFDYKNYLDTGDGSDIPKLQPLDTIFVPASPLIGKVQVEFDARTLMASGDGGEREKSVTVFGEVIKPGTFSYEPETTVVDLIMRAGGVTRYAGVEKIRVISQGKPLMFNLKNYLDSGATKGLIAISPGDTIFVPMAVDDIKSGLTVVYVMGEVFKPGPYESEKQVSFLDILANAGGPTRFAETKQIRIIHTDGTITPFDLQSYTEGDSQQTIPQISPGDAIFIPEKTDFNEKSWLKVPPKRAVKVIGEVHHPGRYEWSEEMTLFDLIAHAGGPNHKGNISRLKVLSHQADGSVKSTIFDMAKFIEDGGDLALIPKIKATDTIVVPELPRDPSDNKAQWIRQPSKDSIYIMGEVTTPGRYMFNDSLHFLDILTAAEGPNSKADIGNIRVTHRNGAHAKVSHLNLKLYFETGDENLLPQVLPGDVIYIPAKDDLVLDDQQQQTIRVLGAINHQGRYRINHNMSILDLLAQAGGFAPDAQLSNIVIVNGECCDNHINKFDLMAYTQDHTNHPLPPIRAGDTIYVMNKNNSQWNRLLDGVQDTLGILSVFRILGGG